MKTGNGLPAATDHGERLHLRDDGRQLRDIEELVARLRVVTKRLAFPIRTAPATRVVPASAAAGTARHPNVIAQGKAGEGQAGQPGETADRP